MSIIDSRPTEERGEPVSVSLNPDRLSYASTRSHPLWLHRIRLAIPVAAAVIAIAAMLLVSVRAVSAQSDDQAKLKSVHFDLSTQDRGEAGPLSAAGAVGHARYKSLVVADGGIELALKPLTGPVRITLSQPDTARTAAEIDGLRVGSAAPGYADSLADAATSDSLQRYLRIGGTDDDRPVSLDLTYARPLTAADYLLIQEANGDAVIELVALGADGSVVGAPVTVGPGYQWNTGHQGADGTMNWASVVGVNEFATGSESIAGIRITSAAAEVKAVALTASDSPPPGPSVGEPAQTITRPPSSAAHAAVGLAISAQPAVAVNGEGCDKPDASAATTVGQSATFCYTVTNLGNTQLTDIGITDEQLGLYEAVLPKASGPDVLGPGEHAVYYHHAIVAVATTTRRASVIARPADQAGLPIDGLVAPTAATGPDGGETAGAASEVPDSAVPDAAPTIDATPPATVQPAPGPSPDPVSVDAPPPAVLANIAAVDADGPEEAHVPVTALALTGMVTEPWVMVIFAMGFIFIGYTTYVAFRQNSSRKRSEGHDQLDALGFD